MTIKDLQPTAIWNYFYDVTQIPRPSKKEERILAYLLSFAKRHNLDAKQDEIGNVLITKPATKGKEHVPTVILQSHVDMVCEKNADTPHDFDNDPIQTIIEGDWVRANGTTLGADNGIGVAAQLAVLAADNIAHGKIEALFTVDEETGLTGANLLKKDFLTGNILLNLDTGEEGEIYIGCAGGRGTKAYFNYTEKDVPKNRFWLKVSVKGLLGGHSGCDIEKGLANANKLLARFLYELPRRKYGTVLAEIGGGNLHNAIARESFAVFGVKEQYKEDIRVKLNIFLAEMQNEYKKSEPNLRIELESVEAPKKIINKKATKKLILALNACPHGVIEMSQDIDGLVETSTNLASIKMTEGHQIEVVTSQRSSVESKKEHIVNTVSAVFRLAGAEVVHSDGYPGWQPNTESKILKLAYAQYEKMYNIEPKVKAVHAGLECGLFLEKYPNLDMISIGPDMVDIHSPDERLKISSVTKFWDFLVKILENV
jgi:dipeptidase D